MKAVQPFAITQLKYPQFWLLGIGACLMAIHLALVCKSNDPSFLGISFLFWGSVSCLIWEKRYTLNLESGIFSSFLGLSIIALLLVKSASQTSFGGFLYISSTVFAFGFALLASGFQGLKQYKGELLVLSFLSASKLLAPLLMNISSLTAKFAAFILWYTGSEVTLIEDKIILPTGSVEVYRGCSGIELVFQLLGLGLIFLLMFSQKWKHKILVPIVAATIAFIVNALRVALMAILAAKNQQKAFDYWHTGDGSLIFSLIAVLSFGLFCWFLLEKSESKNQAERKSLR